MSTTTWVIDAAHSELLFKVKHLMISNVKGQFTSFTGTITCDGDDFSTMKVHATVNASSISTNNIDRDGHLKSADFFDADKFPTLTFSSTQVEKKGENELSVTGDLTIKGVTKPVVLDVEAGGINKDPWGNTKAGFSFQTRINRKDFGLNWNAALETGGVLVSDEVTITGDIQLTKQA